MIDVVMGRVRTRSPAIHAGVMVPFEDCATRSLPVDGEHIVNRVFRARAQLGTTWRAAYFGRRHLRRPLGCVRTYRFSSPRVRM